MLSLNAVKTSLVTDENVISLNVIDAGSMDEKANSRQLEAVITDWSFFSLKGMAELKPSPLEIRLINDVIAAVCVGSNKFSEQLLTRALSNYEFYPEFVERILNASVIEMAFRSIDTEGLMLSYRIEENQETGILEFHFGKNGKQGKAEYAIPQGWVLSSDEQSVVDELLDVMHSIATTETKGERLALKINEMIGSLLASNNADSIEALNRIVLAVEDQSGYHFKLGNDLRLGNYIEYSEEYGSLVTYPLDAVQIAA
jgi:hypothetical protein